MGNILTHIGTLVLLIWIIASVFTTFVLILKNRDPVKTVSWILVVWLVPYIGLFFYFLFGQYFRKQKIFSRKGLKDLERIRRISQQQIKDLKNTEFLKDEKIKCKVNIMTLLLNNSKAILTEWNDVKVFGNGRNTFDAMLEAIGKASDHIHIEFYRWESDNIGEEFKNALISKAKEGVRIRMIYDDVGSWKLSKTYLESLRDVGVMAYAFMPVSFPWFTSTINYRNHRKILVIDGVTGFVGGINIADKYASGTKKLGTWRDTHLGIRGEAVNSLQTIFSMDWYFVSGYIIGNHSRYFPKVNVQSRNLIQITASGPDSDWASIFQAYLIAISSARSCVYISTPYFSPNGSIRNLLHALALSGVDVRILLPAKSDSTVAYWNSFSYISRMLEAGIKVYLYEKGFNHSKVLIVDDIFTSVGTANFDNRSFDLNFEVNALIYNEEITKKMIEMFQEDLKHSRRILSSEWKTRPLIQKIKESTCRILGPLY
jgi:cardiolipin synthase